MFSLYDTIMSRKSLLRDAPLVPRRRVYLYLVLRRMKEESTIPKDLPRRALRRRHIITLPWLLRGGEAGRVRCL